MITLIGAFDGCLCLNVNMLYTFTSRNQSNLSPNSFFMKVLANKLFLVVVLLVSVSAYITSCTNKDVEVPPPASNDYVYPRGVAVLKPGTMTVGDTSMWKLDKAHSNVMWSTNYLGAAGLLTGRFNQFGVHDVNAAKQLAYAVTGQPLKDSSWAFDEAHPENSYFNGYVQINQSNTGEPGRDGGCFLSTMGTTAIVAGTQNLTEANIARIKTTKIEFDPYSADYLVTANLIWKGPGAALVTKSIVGKLKFVPPSVIGAGTATTYKVFGLQFKFQFNCRDFSVASTNVADIINVECNMNFNNK